MSEAKVLHIYGQHFWHDEAYIVGNRGALIALRDAIDEALARMAGELEVFTNDGEGHHVCIAAVGSAVADRLILPYTEDIARDRHKNQITGAEAFYAVQGGKVSE